MENSKRSLADTIESLGKKALALEKVRDSYNIPQLKFTETYLTIINALFAKKYLPKGVLWPFIRSISSAVSNGCVQYLECSPPSYIFPSSFHHSSALLSSTPSLIHLPLCLPVYPMVDFLLSSYGLLPCFSCLLPLVVGHMETLIKIQQALGTFAFVSLSDSKINFFFNNSELFNFNDDSLNILLCGLY